MKYVSLGKMKRDDWAKAFWIGFLAGLIGISGGDSASIWSILFEMASLLGVLSGLVWVYLRLSKKQSFSDRD